MEKHRRNRQVEAECHQASSEVKDAYPWYAYLMTLVILGVTSWMLFLAVRNIGLIISTGKICHVRRGCKSWDADPWLMFFDAASHAFFSLILIGVIAGCLSVFAGGAKKH